LPRKKKAQVATPVPALAPVVGATIERLVERARAFKPKMGGGTGGDNAVYGYGSVGGDTFNLHDTSFPCHANLKYADESMQTIYSVFCRANEKSASEEVSRAYFNWITSRTDSPWRDVLKLQAPLKYKEMVTGTQDFEWQFGFVFDNVKDLPSNLLMNFFVGTRMLKEWPKAITQWHNLVTKEGIDPAVAFFYLRLFYYSKNLARRGGIGDSNDTEKNVMSPELSSKGRVFVLANAPFYDWPLDVPCAGPEYFENFVLGKAATLEKPFTLGNRSVTYFYNHINNVWGDNDKSAYSEGTYLHFLYSTYGNLGEITDIKTLMGKPRSSIQNWAVSWDELLHIMRSEQERIGRKVAGADDCKAA
jgi:hypothetical protein